MFIRILCQSRLLRCDVAQLPQRVEEPAGEVARMRQELDRSVQGVLFKRDAMQALLD